MARYRSSGIIADIRGSVGDAVFTSQRGVPYIRRKGRKPRHPNNANQSQVREIWKKLINSYWHELSFTEWALWEDYARRVSGSTFGSKKIGLMNRIGSRKMSGFNAYVSLNLLLTVCGFSTMSKPPHPNTPKPLSPLTDLINCGSYQGELRFKIWLPFEVEPPPVNSECICQVWVKFIKDGAFPYIYAFVPVSITPTEVVIDKIRFKKGSHLVEENLASFHECKLRLQFRVVSSKGTYSLPTPIYMVQIKNQ